MRASINRFWAYALIVFVAHNCEEAIVIASGWAERHLPRLFWTAEHWPLFAGVAAALTVSVTLVAWSLRAKPERSRACLRLFLWIMLLNACWHLGVSAYTKSIAPGVVTALLLVIPIYLPILRSVSRARSAASPAP